jgi:hypothetical protein
MRHCSFVVNFEMKTATAHIQALAASVFGHITTMKILGLFFKGLKIAMIGLALFAVGFMIYLVTQMSATYGPLKSYDVQSTTEELHKKFVVLDTMDSTIRFTMTDTVGPLNDKKFYCTIIINDKDINKKFDLAYEAEDDGTKLDLIGAFDFIKKVGGYKADIDGIENLIAEFDGTILKHLRSNTSR